MKQWTKRIPLAYSGRYWMIMLDTMDRPELVDVEDKVARPDNGWHVPLYELAGRTLWWGPVDPPLGWSKALAQLENEVS